MTGLHVVRLVSVFVVSTVAATLGCATTAAPSTHPGAAGAQALDPERAYVSLEKIIPIPDAPPPADPIKPLSDRAARQLAKARKLGGQSRYTEAMAALDAALRYEPKHPEVHVALARLNLRSGNLERARHHADKAIHAAPNAIAPYLVLGRYHAAHGEHADAITAYRMGLLCREAPRLDETPWLIHYFLAQSLYEERYLTAALDELSVFLAGTEPNGDEGQPKITDSIAAKRTPALELSSVVLERLGRFAEAARTIHAMVQANPENADRTVRCARLWLAAAEYDLARQTAESLTKFRPRRAFDLLLDIHTQAHTLHKFAQTLRDELSKEPDNGQRAMNLARALVAAERPAEARQALSTYLDRHPKADVARQRLIALLIGAERWADAIRQCGRGIVALPDRYDDYTAIAQSLGGNPKAAQALLERAANGAFAHYAEQYMLGEVATGAGQFDLASEFFEQCHRQEPTFVPNRVALAEALLRVYRYEDAIEVASRREDGVAESCQLERLLGTLYDRLDDRTQAELHFRAALQLNRDDRGANLGLVRMLLGAQENNRAKLHLRTVLQRDPTFDDARELLASIYSNELKLDAAIEQLQTLRRLTERPIVRARCDALLGLRKTGDLEGYRTAIRAAMKSCGEDAISWIALADSYGDAQKEEAAVALEHALTVDPGNEDAYERLVAVYARLLLFERAASLRERFIVRRPNRHAWRLQLLGLWELSLQDDKALALIQTELGRDDLPDRIRNRYRDTLLNLLNRAGQEAQALRLLEQWHEDAPTEVATAAELAMAYIRQKQPGRAVSIFQALHEQDPENESLHERLIDTLLLADRHERAAQHALVLLERDPANEQSIAMMATILSESGQTVDALELIENQLSRTENREAFQDIALGILLSEKNYDRALERTEKLLDGVDRVVRNITQDDAQGQNERHTLDAVWSPNRPFSLNRLEGRRDALRLQLCSIEIADGRYAEASRHIVSWLASSPNRRQAFRLLLRLRDCQTLLGKSEEAAETTERALLLENDHIGLNNDAAYGWIDRGVRLDEAEQRIRAALARNPSQGAYLDTFGWLMYKKGAFEEAKKWLLRARAFQSAGDAVIFDHLGDACWRLGQHAEAIEHWAAALEKLADADRDNVSADEERVRKLAPEKIKSAQSEGKPSVAPLAQTTETP